uniref:BolA-like protein n=1 Tax=Panagrellus redivivus TaxID=6233 RepID=A0A7E4UV82_PANRE
MTTQQTIKEKLELNLDTDIVQVHDLSDGCGDKYDIVVAAARFKDMNTLARHRLIHSILKQELKFAHAVTLHTFSIEEYEKAVEFQIPKKKVLESLEDPKSA